MIQTRGESEMTGAERAPTEQQKVVLVASKKFQVASLALTIGFLIGCGAARPSKYYQLTVPPSAASVEKAGTVPVTLLLGGLTSSHLYREDRIVYGNGPEKLGTYEFERWAEPPAEMIQEVLLRHLRASGRYRAVHYRRSNMQGDFAVRGRLYDFKELTGRQISARVTFELEMRDLKTGATVWTHYYTHDEPVDGKVVQDVVAALDRNVQHGVSEVVTSLDQYFTSHPFKE
jgi:ABC-type uncharacterized transport system auxiliary subunit